MKPAAMLTLLALSACSQSVASGAASSTSTSSSPPASLSAVPAGKGDARFDVHEWGLVDVAGTNARLLAGPPQGPTNWNAPRRKPVLYFHLADGAREGDAAVKVHVASPGIVEHVPAGTLSDDHADLSWPDIHLRSGSCAVSAVPARDAPECKTSDGVCEAVELKRYETSDSDCIHTNAGDFNHLFYRAVGPAPALPFDVTAKGGSLVIAHARADDFVGAIIWVHREVGTVTVSLIAAPAVGAQVEVAPPKESDVASAQQALDTSMRETGLTDAEILAFDRAWSNDLFGPAAAREAPTRRGSPGPQDYLLFALPQSMMSGASELTITPAPRALKRFMLVRMAV